GSTMKEFVSFLSIPNLAKDTSNIKKNTSFIMDMMKNRGIQNIQLLQPVTADAPPVVYGDVNVPGARQTLVFYAHYQGQPVDPSQWAKGLAPFEPKLFTAGIDNNGSNIPFPNDGQFNPQWRIYGRSSSDDKAGVDVILNAY